MAFVRPEAKGPISGVPGEGDASVEEPLAEAPAARLGHEKE
jgi:hypothetical protein